MNWDPRAKRQAAERKFWLLGTLLLLTGALEVYAAYHQPVSKASALPGGIGVLVVLLLFGLIGLVIGQLLEVIFAFIERNALDIVAYLGYGLRWLYSAETEVESARQWLANASSEANRVRNEVLDFSPERWQSVTPEQQQAIIADARKADLKRQAKTPERILTQLRQQMVTLFGDEEINNLCFDLGVDYESLPGQGKSGKVRELIRHEENRGRTSELIAKCNELRSGQFGLDASEVSTDAASTQAGLITTEEWFAAVAAHVQTQLESAYALEDLAKHRVAQAESEHAQVVEAPRYIKAKRILAVILSFSLGLLTVLISQLQILALLGVSTLPSSIDLVLSGLIVGSGAYPVHSLVKALQGAGNRAQGQ